MAAAGADALQAFQMGTDGRVLYLTRDPELIRRQLAGEVLSGLGFDDLLPSLSTDALLPGPGLREPDIARFTHWCCANLPNKAIAAGELQAAFDRGLRFEVVVAGPSFGRGSSRENAPLAQKLLGTRLIVAPSFERIYADNGRAPAERRAGGARRAAGGCGRRGAARAGPRRPVRVQPGA
jgi:3-isopropylmalate/(R)-2-methylmalate dehydratase large subunit